MRVLGKPDTPPHRIVAWIDGPDMVWLREKQRHWRCSEGEAVRRLISVYRQVEQKVQAENKQ